jgi:hypothetical protein
VTAASPFSRMSPIAMSVTMSRRAGESIRSTT